MAKSALERSFAPSTHARARAALSLFPSHARRARPLRARSPTRDVSRNQRISRGRKLERENARYSQNMAIIRTTLAREGQRLPN